MQYSWDRRPLSQHMFITSYTRILEASRRFTLFLTLWQHKNHTQTPTHMSLTWPTSINRFPNSPNEALQDHATINTVHCTTNSCTPRRSGAENPAECSTPTGKADCNTRYVAYLIQCKKCNRQYVGQTSQSLKSRFSRYLTQIRNQKRWPTPYTNTSGQTTNPKAQTTMASNHFKWSLQAPEKLANKSKTNSRA